MKLLITSATSRLGQTVANVLDRHELRLTDRVMSDLPGMYVCAPLEHDGSTNLLVQGMDAIVVVGEPLADESGPAYLDAMTRRLYNLLMAAYQEGVRRVVYLSTLQLMTAYGPEFVVTERWRPRPTVDPPLLGKHLGEYVCREFAREHKLTVVVLRLGTVVAASDVTGDAVDPLWLEQTDLGAAIEGALTAEVPPWTVLHIQGNHANAQFPTGDAARLIGFASNVDFTVPPHMH